MSLAILCVLLALLYLLWEVPLPLIALSFSIYVGWVFPAVLACVGGLGYLAFVIAQAWPHRNNVPNLFKTCRSFPFGTFIFSLVLIPWFAPHKAILRLHWQKWTNDDVEAILQERFWLQNPFRSVDLAALISAGEMVGFGVCLPRIQASGMRAIPTEVSAVFHQKARGQLKVSSSLPASVSYPAGAHSHSAKIFDKTGKLCAEVTTKFVVSSAAPTR
jgi:hypothetical protein